MSLTGKCPILSDWTIAPWKRILEGLEEIEDAPADNHIIIETHKTANLRGNERKQHYLSLITQIYKHTGTGDKQHAVC